MPAMIWSSAVLFELVLFVSGLVALALLRPSGFPATLFWALGIGAIAVTALAGALSYAGFEAVRPAHAVLNRLATDVAVPAFLFAAFFGLWPAPSPPWSLSLAAIAVGVLLLAAAIGLPAMGVPPALAGMVLVFLFALLGWRWRSGPSAWAMLGVALAAMAEAGRRGLLAELVPGISIDNTDLYHLGLALALLAFGLAGRGR